MKLVLLGAGQRGMIYAQYAFEKGGAEIVAVAEKNEARRKAAAEKYNIPDDMQFEDVNDVYKRGKIGDAVILATMDRDHFKHIIPAIELGYDILLEKPISPNPRECMIIKEKAHLHNVNVVVCHVLRYTAFFSTIKSIIDSGELGKVVTIQHAENIGNFHIAHSFVRGNWRNSEETSPIIMQKSCHDMDILLWLVGSNCKRISSFGSLTYFKEANAPKESTNRCIDCSVGDSCRFNAMTAYLPIMGNWPATVLTEDQTEEGLLKAIKEGPYGRCVYRCDNNVCDNQVTVMEFENGVTATFHLSGLTNKMHRTIKIMCENGDIYGDDAEEEVIVTKFSPNGNYEGEVNKVKVNNEEGFHGGGDYRLVMDFLEASDNENSVSSIDKSIESHLMACAAEKSRLTGEVIEMDELREELSK